MVDLSDSAPSVLDGYISEADLARQLNRSVRTLQRLAARRLGPPRTKIGRLIFYNVEHVRDWISQRGQPSLFSFENEEFVFPAVHHATRFCLFTVGSWARQAADAADFVFFARQVVHLNEAERHFALTAEDLPLCVKLF